MEAFKFLKHRVGRILEVKATRSEEKVENTKCLYILASTMVLCRSP